MPIAANTPAKAEAVMATSEWLFKQRIDTLRNPRNSDMAYKFRCSVGFCAVELYHPSSI
jgi:hypothetical protein